MGRSLSRVEFVMPDNRPGTSSSGQYSVNSSMDGTKKKSSKKGKVVPLSLEEVFNELSTVTSSNLNPPPTRLALTPRSAEICLKLGINPEILKIRDIDSFWEPGMDPAVQRIRHEAYVQRRHDTMKECRLERKRMTVAEFEASTNLNNGASMTAESILEQQREAGSSLIKMEKARIAKMQERQKKELEQMIQFEVQRAKLQEDMSKRTEQGKKKDAMEKKQMEKRSKLMAEERRLRELQKAAMEEAEEQQRIAMAKQMHERELQFKQEKMQKEKEAKRQARIAEIERNAKNAEHRAQVEKFFQDEQIELRKRLDNMHVAEEKKCAAILERQARLAEELRVKRAAIEKRIAANMEMAKLVEQKRKDNFLAKQDHHERIRQEKMLREEEERRLRSQEVELQEQRRQLILLQQRKAEEQKAELMLQKFEQEEEHVEQIKELREKDHKIQTERKNLRTQMKLENVERVQRIKEYKRMSTLKKIETTEQRTTAMIEQRRALIADRKKAAAKTKLQKETISKVMEEVRTNASKANKIITQALSGKISLESLTGPTSGKKKRTKSASKGRSKGDSGDYTDSRINSNDVGLGRQSQSAEGHRDREELDDDEMEAQKKMYSVASSGAPQPYKSPYD